MWAFLAAAFEKFVFPELMKFIREHLASTGTLPDDAAILAHLNDVTSAGIAKGEEWLASHPSV
jgi:hypothetical protein